MKKQSILYFGFIGLLSSLTQLSAMDIISADKNKPTTASKSIVNTLVSAQRISFIAKNNATDEYSYYLEKKNNPLLCCGTIKAFKPLTSDQATTALDNLRKNNPDIQAQLNDPETGADFRYSYIKRLTTGEISTALPVQYLVDKKPRSIIYYAGMGQADNENGRKLSENAGNRITQTTLFSPNAHDPAFVENSAQLSILSTSRFAFQANKCMSDFEEILEEKEHSLPVPKTERYAPLNSRVKIGDEFGITSGWNGGKSLMDTEKRNASSRPK